MLNILNEALTKTSESQSAILNGTVCIACERANLIFSGDAVACQSCGTSYDNVNGVPCLVRYQPDEVLSLIEILANLDTDRVAPTREAHDLWIRMLGEYHQSNNREQFLNTLTDTFQKFLPHRYRQYSLMMRMIENISLKGKSVLDTGAGEGFDAALLQSFGCKVTAVEFSPISAALGKQAVPEANWFCGSVHALPFPSESFDYVFCQAALHHFTDVSAAIREMLRVLKIGGTLFTISDSYRSIHRPEDSILKQFNNDAAVLRGVNENVPSINTFFDPILEFQQALDVSIYTGMVYNYIDTDGKRVNLEGIRRWDYPEAYSSLSTTDGGLSLKITKKNPTYIVMPLLTTEVCRPTILADRQAKKAQALSNLATQLPNKYVNTAFPGAPGNSKFQLLNGWRYRDSYEAGRTAYSRSRWFLSRIPEQQYLRLEVAATADNATRGDLLEIYISGELRQQIKLNSETFQVITTSLTDIPVMTSFCVEMKYAAPHRHFEDAIFRVKTISLRTTETDDNVQPKNL